MNLKALVNHKKLSLSWRVGALASALAGLIFLVTAILSSPAFAEETEGAKTNDTVAEQANSELDSEKSILLSTKATSAKTAKNSAASTASANNTALANNAADEAQSKISEEQIPLNLDKNLKPSESGSSTVRVIFSLIVVSIMAGAAYFLVKKQAYKHRNSKYQPQIKVLTQHFLGPKRSLAVIRVAGESILIGITDQNISMIKALSLLDEELPTDVPAQFSNLMANNESNASSDDDSISGIKDSVVSKLKEMRSFQ